MFNRTNDLLLPESYRFASGNAIVKFDQGNCSKGPTTAAFALIFDRLHAAVIAIINLMPFTN
jgi:hypothetical protein